METTVAKEPKTPATFSNDHLTFETKICRMELDGQTVNVTNLWIRVVKPYP
jgi:hypothetical protein